MRLGLANDSREIGRSIGALKGIPIETDCIQHTRCRSACRSLVSESV